MWSRVLQVAGRWAFGWALAGVLAAVLLGRLRPIRWILTCRLFTPVAALSYSAYLLQDFGLNSFPAWQDAGVTTLWAAWGAALLAMLVVTVVSLGAALPFYLFVERPFTRLLPRGH